MTERIIVSDEESIRTITMRRPEKKNMLTQEMYLAMSDAIDSAQSNPAIRCLILTGRSGVFTAAQNAHQLPGSVDNIASGRIGWERSLGGSHAGNRPMSFGDLLFRLDTEFLNDLACGPKLFFEKPLCARGRHRVTDANIKAEGGSPLLHFRGI